MSVHPYGMSIWFVIVYCMFFICVSYGSCFFCLPDILSTLFSRNLISSKPLKTIDNPCIHPSNHTSIHPYVARSAEQQMWRPDARTQRTRPPPASDHYACVSPANQSCAKVAACLNMCVYIYIYIYQLRIEKSCRRSSF